MYIQRVAEKRLNEIIAGKKVGIILGARQVGKTTLVNHALAGRRSITLNFDIEIDKQRFLAAVSLAPADALKTLGNPEILVIDEAQRLPDSARIVKGWYDAGLPLKVLLLGSSSLHLLSQTAETLTGRNEKLFLPPLVFEEMLRTQAWYSEALPRETILANFAPSLRTFLMETMVFGSYPEVAVSGDKLSLLRNLASDYLWKDILQTGLVKTPDLIKRLLSFLAQRTGEEISIYELSVQLQMTRPTVERYLDLLEQTHVIFRVSPYSTNPRKEIVRKRKVYFWDTGIRNALLNAFGTEEIRPDIEQLWNNWVIAEIAKQNLLAGQPRELFFWRSRAQSEVDLVIKEGETLRACEISWFGRPSSHRAFKDIYGADTAVLSPSDPFLS